MKQNVLIKFSAQHAPLHECSGDLLGGVELEFPGFVKKEMLTHGTSLTTFDLSRTNCYKMRNCFSLMMRQLFLSCRSTFAPQVFLGHRILLTKDFQAISRAKFSPGISGNVNSSVVKTLLFIVSYSLTSSFASPEE